MIRRATVRKRLFSQKDESDIRARLVARLEECSGQVHQGLRELMNDAVRDHPSACECYENIGADILALVTDRRRYECQSLLHAIHRLDSGDLGFCEDCDGQIRELRIRRRNEAVTCIPCQERREAEGPLHEFNPFPGLRERLSEAAS